MHACTLQSRNFWPSRDWPIAFVRSCVSLGCQHRVPVRHDVMKRCIWVAVTVKFLSVQCNPFPPPPIPVPSPPIPPDFTLTDSLTRPPTTDHPAEPVLAGDDLAQSSNTSSQGGTGGSHHSVDIVSTANADQWAGWRKLFQRALPFLLIGTALCCSCMACCGCYIAFKRLSQPSFPSYGPGQPAPYWGQPPPPAWTHPPAQRQRSWSSRHDWRDRECRL